MMHLEAPQYVAMEKAVADGQLLTALCNPQSSVFVLPSKNAGLGGFYKFIGYLGKSSFTERNQQLDLYVDSTARKKNLAYTDYNNWFSTIKHREGMIQTVKKINKQKPLLFICAELPFYGPQNEPLPSPFQSGNDWIIHLDLTSRLACYLLGKETVKIFSERVSANQLAEIPVIWPNLL
jgi:hypothetical protein